MNHGYPGRFTQRWTCERSVSAIIAIVTDESDPTRAAGDPCDDDKEAEFTHSRHEHGWVSENGTPMVPWLVVYGLGPASEEVAEAIAEQCAGRCVRAVLHTLDEAATFTLSGFMGLVLVLPSVPPPRGQEHRWKEYRKLADRFRERNLSAAEAFVLRSGCWERAGVLTVVYTEDALADPAALELIKNACASHAFVAGVPFTGDLFAIFQPGMAQIKTADQVAAAVADNWRRLRAWGIDTVEKARIIKTAVDDRRDQLDHDAKKPAMHRPIRDVDMNRLDLVLFRPTALLPAEPDSTDDERTNAAENFRANGARVVRKLVEALERDYPWFHCPRDKAGKKFAQARFAEMYKLLRTVVSMS